MRQKLKPLFIFELANNHNGKLERGKKIINDIKEQVKEYKKDFDFAFKLQYRNLDTFIHPEYKNRDDIKFIKRFNETRLSKEENLALRDEIKKQGFISVCTAFDEDSVDAIEEQGYDFIKIASCSFCDWSLLEKIATKNMPIIASTAGVEIDDIDKVVQFFLHREKNLSLLHCVAEYPTKNKNLQLNQIDLLKSKYPEITIGYSTHESPENMDNIKMAMAKGARIFEKHVGLDDYEGSINGYSATPKQISQWLKFAKEAFVACGVEGERYKFTQAEMDSLKNLSRGVFASKNIKKGESIDNLDTFLAIPTVQGHLLASDLSKYKEFVATSDIKTNSAILLSDVAIIDVRAKVESIINKVKAMLNEARIILPNKVSFEISHHYGLDKFDETGAVIINCVNREYCKKLLVMMPNQNHPTHLHKVKEETFQVLYGDMTITIDGVTKNYKPGDIELVKRGIKHCFSSKGGAIFEEISTGHFKNDSYYDDSAVAENKNRKTNFTYWTED
ncbi:MAG: N-acetylneuraminate synthase family protein [Candidatus Gastranaerophilaceae bacterium]